MLLNYKKNIYIVAFAFLLLYCTLLYIFNQYIQLQYTQNLLTKDELTTQYQYIILLLILFSLFTLFSARHIEKVINKARKKQSTYIKQLEDINTFLNLLQNCSDLKSVSKTSIQFIANEFNPSSALLYLVNYKNLKLLLLDGYNVNLDKTSKVLDLYHGLCGEAFSAKKIKKYYKNNSVYFAIPLITKNTVVGVIQLNFKEEDYTIDPNKIQKTMLNIISDTLLKNLEHSKNKKYLDLIDKYVLISSTNANGDITYASEAFCNSTGYTKKELIGSNHRMMRDPNVAVEVFQNMWKTAKSGKTWRGEFSSIKKDGSLYWADTTVNPRYDLYNNIIGYDAIRVDISDKKRIERISITDSLTSLYNRRYFDKLFPAQLKMANRTDEKLALLMIDIDHFKQYNDTYGHQEGDGALQKVAQTLQSFAKRENDYAFRLGGEEFAMLFFIKDETDALTIANNLNLAVKENKIIHEKNSASKYLTVSIGLFICNNEHCVNNAYKEADNLLYKAKQKGRNQVVSNINGEIND